MNQPRPRRPKPLPKPPDDGVIRSEGQALLWQVRGSLDDIGRAVGARAQAVHTWRSGKIVPSERMRIRLEEMYAIPRRAWALKPGHAAERTLTPPATTNGLEKPEVPAAALAPPEPAPDTLSGCLALHTRVRAAQFEPGLTAAERVKLSDTEAKVLALRHRLEREGQMLEARIIREHPRWQAVQRAIASAIGACPRCTKLVIDALTRLDV